MKSINKLKSWVFNFKRFWTENPRAGSSILSLGTKMKSSRGILLELFLFGMHNLDATS